MLLEKNHLQELLELAKKAALLAGKVISDHQGQHIELEHKEGGVNIASQVVSKVDHLAQEVILNTLAPSIAKYDLGLLAEESVDDNSRFKKDYFWSIDPLDGTYAFSKNEDGYSTSIALVSKSGTPIIGVVYNPRVNDLYYAVKACGAFKNDSPLNINKANNYLSLYYDKSFLKSAQFDEDMKILDDKVKELGLTKIEHSPLGGAVMNAISTIENAPAVYYKHPKKEKGGGSLWDFAASSIIHSEAGGINSDFLGAPLDLNRKDCTFMNHRGIKFSSSALVADSITMY